MWSDGKEKHQFEVSDDATEWNQVVVIFGCNDNVDDDKNDYECE